jgi:hypothetical protein
MSSPQPRRRHRARRPFVTLEMALDARSAPDRREIARFLREQPPQLAPPRTDASTLTGLVAWSVLGYRVVRRVGG